jgi:hypothetical protein
MATEHFRYVFGYQFAKSSVILSGSHHWAGFRLRVGLNANVYRRATNMAASFSPNASCLFVLPVGYDVFFFSAANVADSFEHGFDACAVNNGFERVAFDLGKIACHGFVLGFGCCPCGPVNWLEHGLGVV